MSSLRMSAEIRSDYWIQIKYDEDLVKRKNRIDVQPTYNSFLNEI